MMTRGLNLGARVFFITVLLLTAIYGLLAYVPFLYAQVIQYRLISGLSMFAEWHPVFVWGATLSLAWARRDDLRRKDAGLLLWLAMTAVAVAVTWHPVLRNIRNDASSLLLALASLVLVFWLVVLDVRALWPHLSWNDGTPDDDGRLWRASVAAAVYAWAVYGVVWWSRNPTAAHSPGAVLSLVWSLSVHGLVFAAAFLVLMLIRGLAATTSAAGRLEFVLGWLVTSGAVATGFARVVFPALAFVGPIAWGIAAALGLALGSVLADLSLFAKASFPMRAGSGIAAWLAPGRRTSVSEAALRLVALAVVAVMVADKASSTDWNFLIQKISAVVCWAIAIRTLFAVSGDFVRLGWPSMLATAAVAPIGFTTLVWTADRAVADRYANFDPSFRAIYDVVRPPETDETDAGFYQYLEANTNISRDRRVEPVDVNFVDTLRATTGFKPHIFVIVVDSLRRDYLSPYNPAVTFTPAAAAFGAESDVFTHAFTRYGATGLSEPSIWTGGMLVHKQYVTPFAPMNALEKLLVAERYRQFVSLDSILRVLMPPPEGAITEIDAGIQNKDYDLCRSLPELRAKVASAGGDAPIFAYTQPQNVHISAIAREGKTVPAGQHYPGFYEPYAARVRRLDGCFGTFIASLKTSGLYDSSIVILTADHGDSLGEEGRFGHAYTVFPEVMRIPLMIHVPPVLRGPLSTNHDATVFSTDITPTLYGLLGHRPTLTAAPFGRPLFVEAGQALPAWRGDTVVASSYGTVYGLLRDAGQRLYIVDAVNFRDYSYSLASGLVGSSVPVTSRERVESQREIRNQVAAIARFYHVDAAAQ